MRILALWVWCGLLVGAEEPDLFHTISADGRFHVSAPRPEDAQNLSVWAVRSLAELEKQTGRTIPFGPGQTLGLRVRPDMTGARLATFANGRQEILLGDREPAGRPLAEAFTRACLIRVLAGTEPPEPLVSGFAHFLLLDETRRLFALSFESPAWERMPPPEDAWRMPPGPARDLYAVWVQRWLFRAGGPARRDPAGFWRSLAQEPQPSVTTWLAWGDARDLRELHLRWDLWRSTQERSVMSEHRLEALSERRMAELVRFRPAEFGIGGALPRYQPIGLADLEPLLDEPWMADFLRQWIVRIQSLRFRQSEAFTARVDAHAAAAQFLLEASQRRGKARESALKSFREALP